MRTACYEDGILKDKSSLLEALELGQQEKMIISLTGAGGKTTTMYRLAKEFSDAGKKVIITTTTHILIPENHQVIIADNAEVVRNTHWEADIVVTGMMSEAGKLKSMPVSEVSKLSGIADVLLIEADGAKTLPLKVPAGHEPVIIPETQFVIGCCGIDCIGRRWSEACFRIGQAENIYGINHDDYITPEDVAVILADKRGTKKCVEGAQYRILINKADNEEAEKKAAEVLKHIRNEKCIVVSYRAGQEKVNERI